MDRLFRVKVWKDRMAHVYPPKWCWEVSERSNSGKTIGCGTTHSEKQSREVATQVVEAQISLLKERQAFVEMPPLRIGGRQPDSRVF